MATDKTTGYEELMKLATDFVTTQKGMWDHAAWVDFVSGLRTKGFELSGDVQTNLGNMLEGMKQLYTAAATTESVEKAIATIVDDSIAFVKRHRGGWGHAEWEDFVRTVERNTFSLSEGMVAYLGGILESTKILSTLFPVGSTRKRPPAPERDQRTAVIRKPAADTADKTEQTPQATKAPVKPASKATATPAPKTPEKQDDLTAIDGIGPVMAKKLKEGGITSYAQLADLSDADIERLDKDVIRSAGRIRRDDWVGQAKKLVWGR